MDIGNVQGEQDSGFLNLLPLAWWDRVNLICLTWGIGLHSSLDLEEFWRRTTTLLTIHLMMIIGEFEIIEEEDDRGTATMTVRMVLNGCWMALKWNDVKCLRRLYHTYHSIWISSFLSLCSRYLSLSHVLLPLLVVSVLFGSVHTYAIRRDTSEDTFWHRCELMSMSAAFLPSTMFLKSSIVAPLHTVSWLYRKRAGWPCYSQISGGESSGRGHWSSCCIYFYCLKNNVTFIGCQSSGCMHPLLCICI